MADERLTTMLRRLEQPQAPSQLFAGDLYATLRPKALEAGRRDATFLGRLTAWLDVRRSIGWGRSLGLPMRVALVALLVLLVVAVATLLTSGRPSGPFVHFTGSGIYRITADGDVATSTFVVSSVAAVSPDGRYAVINSPDSIPATAPTVVDTVAGTSQTLPNGTGAMTAAWSIGDQLAWDVAPTGETEDGSSTTTYATSVDLIRPGEAEARRWSVPDGSPIGEFSWSPDGRRLAISTMGLCDGVTSSRTYILDAKTLEAMPVNASFTGSSFHWAPDGRSILMLTSDACASSGVQRLVSVDTSSGRASSLFDPFESAPPIWIRGGGWLDSPISADADDGRIWQMRPDGSEQRVIAQLPHSPDSLELSPDGTMVLAAVRTDGLPADANYGGSSTTWVFGVDGEAVHAVVDGVWAPWPPAWSPDSRWIVITRAPVGPNEQRSEIKAARSIWMVHPDGTGLQQIVGPGGAVGF